MNYLINWKVVFNQYKKYKNRLYMSSEIIKTFLKYLLSEYIDILKCIGLYFIVLSTMAQLEIERLNEKAKDLLKNPIVYFIVILSTSLLITNDDIHISLLCTCSYFIVLNIAKNIDEIESRLRKLKSNF